MKNIKYSVLLFGTMLMCLGNAFTQLQWYQQTCGTTNALFGVWFTDANTGTVVGSNNTILHTTDAGKTWSPQTSDLNEDFYGIDFSDSLHGWIVGYNGAVLHTTDGGATWIPQSLGTQAAVLWSVFSLDSKTAWIAALSWAGAAIFHSTNGGDSWTIQPTYIETYIGTFAWDVFFTDADTGFAVAGWCDGCSWVGGEPDDGGYILYTTTGGDAWGIQKHDTTLLGLYSVFFTDNRTGIVVGSGGTVLRTTDGGKNWTSQSSGTTADLYDVFFTDADTGIAVGENGTIIRTTNGGETWTKQSYVTGYPLNRIHCIDANTVWVVGSYGKIFSTIPGSVSGIDDKHQEGITQNSPISQSYPNPFNRATSIKFHVTNNCHVRLKIYNMNGQEVVTLVNEKMMPGSHEILWDAEGLLDGVYFYKLEAGSFTESKKLVLIR